MLHEKALNDFSPKSLRTNTLHILGACVSPNKSNPMKEDQTELIIGECRLKIVLFRVRGSYRETFGNLLKFTS